ncbi:MAG TPA: YdeI/OmpD-associated family protein [Pyrinomonadaceae bacterium]|nr:YdeI/OmpD-associated family protein [Pyrinomonadaceae bacterium]
MSNSVTPRFFKTPAAFRKWLAANHDKSKELWVGFYKKSSGKPSITWPESVDEALSFGWIDGVRKRFDDESYVIRFTPRNPNSIWSAVNMRNVERLIKEKRMTPAGMKAYENRKENRSGIYSYEQRSPELIEPYAGILRRNKDASEFFQAQPAGYRKMMNWYIVSAKREATRRQRLDRLIKASAKRERLR